LELLVDVANHDRNKGTTGQVIATFTGIGTLSKSVTMKPGEIQQVIFDNKTFPVLNVQNPQLWWPWQMGAQHMYNLTVKILIGVHSHSSRI
jgi:exo-1,4-beta-D-glucosaminidase